MSNLTRQVLALALALGSVATSARAAVAPTAFDYRPDTAPPVIVSHAGTHSVVRFGESAAPIVADVVRPERSGGAKVPGVLFVHWLGDDPATTNRTEFVRDAAELAKHGVMSLLIDAPWAAKKWFTTGRAPDNDYANSLQYTIVLRRSIDALIALGADPNRIAYVGHDFGAMYGSVLSGVDSRPKYYVLMAGTDSFAQWYLLGRKPSDVAAYRDQMSALDPPQYIATSRAAGFLFQYGNRDPYITLKQAAGVYDAAPFPKAVAFYATGHALDVPAARADRVAWLLNRLFDRSF